MCASFLDGFLKGAAIDLGTVSTLIAIKGKGIVLREPSAVAISNMSRNEIIAIGNAAPKLLGRTPGGITIVHPLKDGVIADMSLATVMLTSFMQRALGKRPSILGLNTVICVPGCITNVERNAIEEAARCAGARNVFILEESLAAAIGAELDIYSGVGSMVVDIGGGTTDAAVICYSGIASAQSVRIGGTHINEAIINYIRSQFGLIIGDKTAENLKLMTGLNCFGDTRMIRIKGRRMDTGLPDTVEIKASDVSRAIEPTADLIVHAIKDTLASTPPELAGDVMDTGITLTGGGALLGGLCERVAQETGIKTHIADGCGDCVIIGALKMLENLSAFEPIEQNRSAGGSGRAFDAI